MGFGIHGISCYYLTVRSYFQILGHIFNQPVGTLSSLSFVVLAQIEISVPFANLRTSIQNGCYAFTHQENILLLHPKGNIRATCTPLSTLFATSVGLFDSGKTRQVFRPSPVQTPVPCCGKRPLSGSAAGHAKPHLQEWISAADGGLIKKLCNLQHIFCGADSIWAYFLSQLHVYPASG